MSTLVLVSNTPGRCRGDHSRCPGLTAEWLQRLVECHLARNAAVGHVVPEMPDCPLVSRGVEARITSAGKGLVVEIRANDTTVAREVLARSQRLTVTPPRGGSIP